VTRHHRPDPVFAVECWSAWISDEVIRAAGGLVVASCVQCADVPITDSGQPSQGNREENPMPLQNNYLADYHNLKLTRDDKDVLVAEFHTNGGPFIMTAQSHTEFVDAFYRIAQDRANKIVILTGAGGEFITDVDWSSFGVVTDPGVWSQVHDEGVQV